MDGRIDEEVVSDSVDVNEFPEVAEVSPLLPDSTCCGAKAICCSVNRERLIEKPPPQRVHYRRSLRSNPVQFLGGETMETTTVPM
jgi:hypothetical protein